jgi:diguanylate cyclase
VRETDFVARYGGEEFVMILEGASINEAFGLVDRLREATGKAGFHFRGEPVSVTISCGITELRDDDTNETVFDRADKLLYKAKNDGRDRCERD